MTYLGVTQWAGLETGPRVSRVCAFPCSRPGGPLRADVAGGRAAAALALRLAQVLLRGPGHRLLALDGGGGRRRQNSIPVPLLPGLQLGRGGAGAPSIPGVQRLLHRAGRPVRPRVLPAVLRGPAGGAAAPGGPSLRPDHPGSCSVLRALPGPPPAHQRPPAPRGLRGRCHLFPAGWVGAVGWDRGPRARGSCGPGVTGVAPAARRMGAAAGAWTKLGQGDW